MAGAGQATRPGEPPRDRNRLRLQRAHRGGTHAPRVALVGPLLVLHPLPLPQLLEEHALHHAGVEEDVFSPVARGNEAEAAIVPDRLDRPLRHAASPRIGHSGQSSAHHSTAGARPGGRCAALAVSPWSRRLAPGRYPLGRRWGDVVALASALGARITP